MNFTASSLYGGAPSPQPTPTAAPSHSPGAPEPMAKTIKSPSQDASWDNPTFLLIALLAIAFGLIRFSVRVGS